jgi:hypothetical protein
MALNMYESNDYEIDDVIQDNLYNLIADLKKEKVNITLEDLQYSFFNRVENLYIKSDYIYPDEDLPKYFGVQRGYNGGGIHSNLQRTEIDRMTKTRQKKANRILDLFVKYFWQILKDVDSIDEDNTGEPKEAWEKLTL